MVAFPGVAQMRSHPRTDTSWQDHAACRNANPAIFFDPERFAAALLICRECPDKAKAPCDVLGRGCGEGVWGGRVHGQRYGRKAKV